jgi:hypothetical protein
MDARTLHTLSAQGQRFDCVIDKGTLDATLCASRGWQNAARIVQGAVGTLCCPGRLVLVSHVQPHTEAFQMLLTRCFAPALTHTHTHEDELVRVRWRLDVHSAATQQHARVHPVVYVLCKDLRRNTRSAARSQDAPASTLPVRFLEH